MDFLISSRTLFGLQAPMFAWIAAFGLVSSALLILAVLVWQVTRIRGSQRSLIDALTKCKSPRKPGDGIPLRTYDEISGVFEKSPRMQAVWLSYSQHIVRRRIGEDDHYWSSISASEIFTDSALTDRFIDRDFYSAIPGALTGTGLLVTFIAILVALLHVKVSGPRVEGIGQLIEGLSGKFISSIAALLAATIFLLLEKPLFYQLATVRRDLAMTVDEVVPVLTATHLLVDLQRDISEQSVAFRSFNADLSGRLRQSFSESMGPTLQRMVEAIDELNRNLRAAEALKQESITNSVGGLVSQLETSITTTLQAMSKQFSQSLSGAAMDQFAKLADSLGGAATLLESMNTQSQTTQSALAELVNLAKNSTAEQMALGKSQIEDLTNVLRAVVTQIEQTAGNSVTTMGATLTAVVHELSTKVTELSEQTRSVMLSSSNTTAEVARNVIEKADAWSSRNSQQLTDLLQKQTSQLQDIDKVRAVLDDSLSRFRLATGEFGGIISKLQQVSSDTGVSTTAMAGVAKSVRDSHEAIKTISSLATSQIEKLADANRTQDEMWKRILGSMEQYRTTFGQVENSAGRMIEQISKHLSQHLEVCKRGYEGLVQVSDEHFANATQRLGASVDELGEYLQDLADAFEKSGMKSKAAGGNHGS